ncbi:hypothetical protein CBR_g34073 [Chara braunii]|uniref:Uncharacterized protein n=1 Tax=Chara braunii TaxID=69332 RepID=A0A388LHU3_CHABU|nr:hypothetical protein CBR_g34073 [Chara braunii]|eukprot:GBG81890.1 hypothetical protein CBR_g34073 [Chara braunii]
MGFPQLTKPREIEPQSDEDEPCCVDEQNEEELIQDNGEMNSQVWDELGKIALDQAERAASRWGSASLGRTVQTFSKADAALAYVNEHAKFICPVILAYELHKSLSGFEYVVMERDDFLMRYRDMSDGERAFYELIHPVSLPKINVIYISI